MQKKIFFCSKFVLNLWFVGKIMTLLCLTSSKTFLLFDCSLILPCNSNKKLLNQINDLASDVKSGETSIRQIFS